MADITDTDDHKTIVVLAKGDACVIYDAAKDLWSLIMPHYEARTMVPDEIAALAIAMTKVQDPDVRREWLEEMTAR